MSTISNNKSILDDLQSTQAELEDLLGDSRYSNSFADIKDSLSDVGEYIDEVKGHITNQIRSVSIRDIKVPNSKDHDEWYAGGDLRNNYYSPTTHAPITNEPKALDLGGMLMLGDFEFLNPAWGAVQYLAQGGVLDLMRDYDKREVEVYSYTVTIKDGTNNRIISERFGEVNISGERDNFGQLSNNAHSSVSNFTTSQIAKMYANKFSFMAGPIKIGVDIVSLTTGEDMSIEETIGAGLVGTAIETVTTIVSQTIASKFGIQSMYGLGIVGTIVGAITNELAQMALGLDNSFGFGGDIIGFSQNGTPMYERKKSISQGLRDMVPDFARDLFGMETTFGDLKSSVAESVRMGSGYADITSYGDISTLNMYDPYTYQQIQIERQYGDGGTFDFGGFENPNKVEDIKTLTDLDTSLREDMSWTTDFNTNDGSDGGSDNDGPTSTSGVYGGGTSPSNPAGPGPY